MKKKAIITYLPPAERDLEEIVDYIRRNSVSGANRFLDKLDRAVNRTARFPESGLIPKDPYLLQKKYRILIIGNYLAFYRIERRRIVFYRILHGKRRYQFLLG
ncbi:MAG: type II toxin-antitoxin system RelE/ParE family toxin [Deltaproteobacteria bacterium]|nr:type II toxin-antitoxin system RelE/ParE family toxin [Deltaproteobacteria bacterium]